MILASSFLRVSYNQDLSLSSSQLPAVSSAGFFFLHRGQKSFVVIYFLHAPAILMVTHATHVAFPPYFVDLKTQAYILFWSPRNLHDPSKRNN